MPGATIICFASWEDRCRLGMARTLESTVVGNVLVFYSNEYSDWTSEARSAIRTVAEKAGAGFKEIGIDLRQPRNWWREIQKSVSYAVNGDAPLIFDYSTCPRNVLWCIASSLIKCGVGWTAIYNPPDPNGYGDWLSADPDMPMLVYGHSGVADPLKSTGLVVTSGYDVQRTAQLYNVYEPERMIVLLQTGEQFDNQQKNLRVHLEWLSGRKDDRLSPRAVNAYASDRGFVAVRDSVDELAKTCNVVLASLGPKVGSLAMYRAWMDRPDCALAYVPSRQYNRDYSHGISDPLVDTFGM